MIITQHKQTDPEGNCSVIYNCRSTAFEDYLLQTQYSVLASVQNYLPYSSSAIFKPNNRSSIVFKPRPPSRRIFDKKNIIRDYLIK